MIDFSIIKRKPATSCLPLIRLPLIRSPLIRTKQSPGEDRRVGWYCYRATQSRRSHLTYTHRKSSYRPKENIFWEKSGEQGVAGFPEILAKLVHDSFKEICFYDILIKLARAARGNFSSVSLIFHEFFFRNS